MTTIITAKPKNDGQTNIENYIEGLHIKHYLVLNIKAKLANQIKPKIGYTDKRPTGTNLLMRQKSYRQTY